MRWVPTSCIVEGEKVYWKQVVGIDGWVIKKETIYG